MALPWSKHSCAQHETQSHHHSRPPNHHVAPQVHIITDQQLVNKKTTLALDRGAYKTARSIADFFGWEVPAKLTRPVEKEEQDNGGKRMRIGDDATLAVSACAHCTLDPAPLPVYTVGSVAREQPRGATT